MNASRHLLDYHSLVRWVVSRPIVAYARARLYEESRAESRTLLRFKKWKGNAPFPEKILHFRSRITHATFAFCEMSQGAL